MPLTVGVPQRARQIVEDQKIIRITEEKKTTKKLIYISLIDIIIAGVYLH